MVSNASLGGLIEIARTNLNCGKTKRARTGTQHEPLIFTAIKAKDDYVAGFGASAGGAGALVAAGVGDEVVAGAAAGAALQPLVQPVATVVVPQLLHGAGAEQQGAGAAQQGAGAAQQARGALQQRVLWQRGCLQQRASAVETENMTAAAANKQNARLILNSFT